jgi:aryl-alcohol dehydrogenase-like predicted oxidoreductase
VSALSLGCMGMHDGRGRAPDEARMERLIRQAYDRGCTFFDTAEGYARGRNEEYALQQSRVEC